MKPLCKCLAKRLQSFVLVGQGIVQNRHKNSFLDNRLSEMGLGVIVEVLVQRDCFRARLTKSTEMRPAVMRPSV